MLQGARNGAVLDEFPACGSELIFRGLLFAV